MTPDSWQTQYLNCLWSRGTILKNTAEDMEIAIEVMKRDSTKTIFITSYKSTLDDRIETFAENKVIIAELENSTLTYVSHLGHDADHNSHSAICQYGKILQQPQK